MFYYFLRYSFLLIVWKFNCFRYKENLDRGATIQCLMKGVGIKVFLCAGYFFY